MLAMTLLAGITGTAIVASTGQANVTPGGALGSASLGYWLLTPNGQVAAYDGAHAYGALGGITKTNTAVAIAATADGHGYWVVTSKGSVFARGDAKVYGEFGSGRAPASTTSTHS